MVDALTIYKLTRAVTELDLTDKVISSQIPKLAGLVMTKQLSAAGTEKVWDQIGGSQFF